VTVLVVHHLDHSRSHRVLWLLEELGVPYEIKFYQRYATTRLAPPDLTAIQPVVKSSVITDGDRVLQIVTNLLSNALHWTPAGGRVDLGLGTASGEVSVAVSDTGPGIEPEVEERIFRPFWSGDDGGTGLGPAIARDG